MTDKEVLREMLTRAGIDFEENNLIDYHSLPKKRVIGRHYDDPPPPTHYGYLFTIKTGASYNYEYGECNDHSAQISFNLDGSLSEITD